MYTFLAAKNNKHILCIYITLGLKKSILYLSIHITASKFLRFIFTSASGQTYILVYVYFRNNNLYHIRVHIIFHFNTKYL